MSSVVQRFAGDRRSRRLIYHRLIGQTASNRAFALEVKIVRDGMLSVLHGRVQVAHDLVEIVE